MNKGKKKLNMIFFYFDQNKEKKNIYKKENISNFLQK